LFNNQLVFLGRPDLHLLVLDWLWAPNVVSRVVLRHLVVVSSMLVVDAGCWGNEML
jgi:hypothetical protein